MIGIDAPCYFLPTRMVLLLGTLSALATLYLAFLFLLWFGFLTHVPSAHILRHSRYLLSFSLWINFGALLFFGLGIFLGITYPLSSFA